MQLEKIKGVREGQYYPYEVTTGIGDMQICLRDNHLFCNFIGNESKAKLIFGHWKVNTPVNDIGDIEQHFKFINNKIKNYGHQDKKSTYKVAQRV